MQSRLLTLAVLAGLATLGGAGASQAAPARVSAPLPAATAAVLTDHAPVLTVQYYHEDWRAREWCRRQREADWRRHEEWRHARHEREWRCY